MDVIETNYNSRFKLSIEVKGNPVEDAFLDELEKHISMLPEPKKGIRDCEKILTYFMKQLNHDHKIGFGGSHAFIIRNDDNVRVALIVVIGEDNYAF
jgi:hypothetical protein